MAHNRFGIHWANVPIGEQLGKWALGAGGDCYLVMDGGHGWIPRIREARPNAIIVHRHAVSNWMDMEPEDWAAQMAGLFYGHRHETWHIELECEPDIFPNFPGWGVPIIDRLKFAADWNIRVAEWLRGELGSGLVIHSPPLAHERLDLPQWFAIWKPVLDVCDVLDMHCYWEKDGRYYKAGLYNPEESYHRAFRYRKIHDFLESQNYHIPMMVTECGNFAPNNLDYADELIYYFSELEKDADYMIGGCVFILKSNIHNWVNDLTRQPNIERFFGRLRNAPKKNLSYPNGGSNMDIWRNVPLEIAQWRKVIEDVTSSHHVPIPPVNDVHVSPAKLLACMIMRESLGKRDATNPETGAAGLMQIMPFHFEPRQDPYEPKWNVNKGLSILADKLYPGGNVARNLQTALFYYSGRANRPWEPFIEKYWNYIVEKYKEFWGIDLEPEPAPNWEAKYNRLRGRADEVKGLLTQIQSDIDRIVNDDFGDFSRMREAIERLLE